MPKLAKQQIQTDACLAAAQPVSEAEARLVRDELDQICKHPAFSLSSSLKAFLSYIVTNTIAGRHDELKEYVIATEVFGRSPSFDPSQNSIVRTQAVKLRTRLREYYATAGSQGPIRIVLRPGRYIAAFERTTENRPTNQRHSHADSAEQGSQHLPLITIATAQPAGQPTSERLAWFASELVIQITKRGHVQVKFAGPHPNGAKHDTLDNAASPNPRFSVLLMEQELREQFRFMVKIADVKVGHYTGGYESEWRPVDSDFSALIDDLSGFIERVVYKDFRGANDVQDPDGQRLCLEGDMFLNRLNPFDCQRALTSFETILKTSSDNSVAWAGSAIAVAYGTMLGNPELEKRKPAARVAAMHAIALDRWRPNAQLAYGVVRGVIDWRFAESETYLKSVLDSRPCPFALMTLALTCWIPRGALQESVDQIKAALKSASTSLPLHYALALALYFSRQYADAQVVATTMASLNGGIGHAAMMQALLHLAHRDCLQEARTAILQSEEQFGRIPSILSILGYIAATEGQTDELAKIQAELDSYVIPGRSFNYERAVLKLGQRKYEEAAALLERAVRNKEFGALFVRFHPLFSLMDKIPAMQIIAKQIA